MGEIYRATDTALGRDVAIKVLFAHLASDEDVRARFTREALAAARLSGEPHTVAIYDIGEADGRPFIVMEYLPGGSLAERLESGRPPPAEALAWIDEAARALDAAHGRGVVHRDVKPANLLLDGAGHVHVADFGIASAAGLDSHTQTGVVLGTLGYLSPEQAAGGKATPASDVYALAVVAAELLGPEAPTAIDRGLAPDPADRYASAGELAAALRAAYAAAEPPTLVMAAEPRRSHRTALAVAVGLLAVGGATAALLTTMGAGASSPPPQPPTVSVVRTVTVPAPLPTEPAPPPPKPEKHPEPAKHDHGHHDHGDKKEKKD
jgi:eukaryotic-like serine/threonine-protein kinase